MPTETCCFLMCSVEHWAMQLYLCTHFCIVKLRLCEVYAKLGFPGW